MLNMRGIHGVRLPKTIQSKVHDEMKLSVEYHLTFLFRDMAPGKEKQFFFGRTARSNKIELTKGKDGAYYTEDQENLYFHSSLKKDGLTDRILLCTEVVLTLEEKAVPRKGRIPERP